MVKRHSVIVTLAATAVLTAATGAASSPAASAAPSRAAFGADHTIAMWNMDERRGARTMYDSSGYRLHGRIGNEVRLYGDGYRFDRLDPDTPPARPGHLVTVPDHRELDPGNRGYAITVRLRTTNHFGNIIQKGQATVAGGSFKMQIPSGKVQCWFRGSSGSVLVTAPKAINDGRWHTIRCERDSRGVSLTIDGRTVAGRYGRTGTIANAWPISIGGKTDCNQVDVGCDYYAGDLDYIAIDVDDYAW